MGMFDLNNEMLEKKRQKFFAERHGLDHCRDDLSDVDFYAGGNNYVLPGLSGLFLLMAFISLRTYLRRRITGTGRRQLGIFIPLVALATLAAVCGIVWLKQKFGGKIHVIGKTLAYNGNMYSAEELNLVKCNAFGTVCVYADGKKVASVSYDEENAELIMAWAQKCGIHVIGWHKMQFD